MINQYFYKEMSAPLNKEDKSLTLHREGDLPAILVYHENGNLELEAWYKEGLLHRDDDLPAEIIYKKEGEKFSSSYYQHGLLHRDNNLPAIYMNTSEMFYTNGNYRNDGDNGYSIFYKTSNQKYWLNEKGFHREDGPACVTETRKSWYINNIPHRIDGPAVIETNGSEKWIIDGIPHRENGPAVIEIDDEFKSIRYYSEGYEHRTDGPALQIFTIEGILVEERWQIEGRHHRDNGAAIITYHHVSGKKLKEEYWKNDEKHRDDGPAVIEYKEGEIFHQEFYLEGEEVEL